MTNLDILEEEFKKAKEPRDLVRCYLAFGYELDQRAARQQHLETEMARIRQMKQQLFGCIGQKTAPGSSQAYVFERTVGVVITPMKGDPVITEAQRVLH